MVIFPWIVFPDLHPNDPATQGVEEAYIDLEWLPFWQALDDRRLALPSLSKNWKSVDRPIKNATMHIIRL